MFESEAREGRVCGLGGWSDEWSDARELMRRNGFGVGEFSIQRPHSIASPYRKTSEPCGVEGKYQQEAVVKAQAKDCQRLVAHERFGA